MKKASTDNINFESMILRDKITHRGGGVEIDLTPFGYEGEKMAAFQNYLGGGMLGRIGVNDTIRANTFAVEESLAKELDKIGDQLMRYMHELTSFGEGELEGFEDPTFEEIQRRQLSAY